MSPIQILRLSIVENAKLRDAFDGTDFGSRLDAFFKERDRKKADGGKTSPAGPQ